MPSFKKISFLLKTALVVGWAALFFMLLSRDLFVPSLQFREESALLQSRQESFTGVYFRGERIGFVKQQVIPNDEGNSLLTQDAFLRLNILGENHPIRLRVKATLSQGQILRDFDFSLASPFYEMQAQGKVQGTLVQFTLSTGKETIQDTVQLSQPPFLATHQRSYLLTQNLEPGDKVKIPYFDPISLTGKETLLEYKGLEKTLVQKRMRNLHHFVETFSGIRINSWLDDEGRVVREESPAGFVFLSEPEFRATDIIGKGTEILSAVSIPIDGPLPDRREKVRLSYSINLPEDSSALRLSDQRQHWQDDTLEIFQEPLPGPSAKACENDAEFLQATPYLQADHSEILSLVSSLTESTPSDWEKIIILSRWVYENLKKRPVIGIPDALTTLRSRQGDCNEHAALFAALARAAGIPCRIAAGVTLMQGSFYYHAWNEVCIDDRWISLDTTANQIPADLTHIKFVQGEGEDMVRIGALLGKLSITVLAEEDTL